MDCDLIEDKENVQVYQVTTKSLKDLASSSLNTNKKRSPKNSTRSPFRLLDNVTSDEQSPDSTLPMDTDNYGETGIVLGKSFHEKKPPKSTRRRAAVYIPATHLQGRSLIDMYNDLEVFPSELSNDCKKTELFFEETSPAFKTGINNKNVFEDIEYSCTESVKDVSEKDNTCRTSVLIQIENDSHLINAYKKQLNEISEVNREPDVYNLSNCISHNRSDFSSSKLSNKTSANISSIHNEILNKNVHLNALSCQLKSNNDDEVHLYLNDDIVFHVEPIMQICPNEKKMDNSDTNTKYSLQLDYITSKAFNTNNEIFQDLITFDDSKDDSTLSYGADISSFTSLTSLDSLSTNNVYTKNYNNALIYSGNNLLQERIKLEENNSNNSNESFSSSHVKARNSHEIILEIINTIRSLNLSSLESSPVKQNNSVHMNTNENLSKNQKIIDVNNCENSSLSGLSLISDHDYDKDNIPTNKKCISVVLTNELGVDVKTDSYNIRWSHDKTVLNPPISDSPIQDTMATHFNKINNVVIGQNSLVLDLNDLIVNTHRISDEQPSSISTFNDACLISDSMAARWSLLSLAESNRECSVESVEKKNENISFDVPTTTTLIDKNNENILETIDNVQSSGNFEESDSENIQNFSFCKLIDTLPKQEIWTSNCDNKKDSVFLLSGNQQNNGVSTYSNSELSEDNLLENHNAVPKVFEKEKLLSIVKTVFSPALINPVAINQEIASSFQTMDHLKQTSMNEISCESDRLFQNTLSDTKACQKNHLALSNHLKKIDLSSENLCNLRINDFNSCLDSIQSLECSVDRMSDDFDMSYIRSKNSETNESFTCLQKVIESESQDIVLDLIDSLLNEDETILYLSPKLSPSNEKNNFIKNLEHLSSEKDYALSDYPLFDTMTSPVHYPQETFNNQNDVDNSIIKCKYSEDNCALSDDILFDKSQTPVQNPQMAFNTDIVSLVNKDCKELVSSSPVSNANLFNNFPKSDVYTQVTSDDEKYICTTKTECRASQNNSELLIDPLLENSLKCAHYSQGTFDSAIDFYLNNVECEPSETNGVLSDDLLFDVNPKPELCAQEIFDFETKLLTSGNLMKRFKQNHNIERYFPVVPMLDSPNISIDENYFSFISPRQSPFIPQEDINTIHSESSTSDLEESLFNKSIGANLSCSNDFIQNYDIIKSVVSETGVMYSCDQSPSESDKEYEMNEIESNRCESSSFFSHLELDTLTPAIISTINTTPTYSPEMFSVECKNNSDAGHTPKIIKSSCLMNLPCATSNQVESLNQEAQNIIRLAAMQTESLLKEKKEHLERIREMKKRTQKRLIFSPEPLQESVENTFDLDNFHQQYFIEKQRDLQNFREAKEQLQKHIDEKEKAAFPPSPKSPNLSFTSCNGVSALAVTDEQWNILTWLHTVRNSQPIVLGLLTELSETSPENPKVRIPSKLQWSEQLVSHTSPKFYPSEGSKIILKPILINKSSKYSNLGTI